MIQFEFKPYAISPQTVSSGKLHVGILPTNFQVFKTMLSDTAFSMHILTQKGGFHSSGL